MHQVKIGLIKILLIFWISDTKIRNNKLKFQYLFFIRIRFILCLLNHNSKIQLSIKPQNNIQLNKLYEYKYVM